MLRDIQEASDFIASRIPSSPRIGLITGTGLGELTSAMAVQQRIPYEEIPHFPRATSVGHRGLLASGRVEAQQVLAMEGRFHLYEGYTAEEIAFPVRVMKRLGAEVLIISSAAGGLNPLFEQRDLMLVTDHINLTGRNPLVGPNLDVLGPRFPDMSRAYDRKLSALAKRKAIEMNLPLREGVYVGILGPSLETAAETRFLRMIGADAVGMSTVLEVIAGVHCGMKILVIVAITNVNLPDCMKRTSIEEVIAAAKEAGGRLTALLKQIILSI